MDERSLPLTVSFPEAFLIAESLRLAGERAWALPQDTRFLPPDTPDKSLEDRFAQAVLTLGEMITSEVGATCQVHITEAENYTLHRWVPYVARIGQEATGLNVQDKLTAQRRAFAADIGPLAAEPPAPTKADVRAKLRDVPAWALQARDPQGRFTRRSG